MICHFVLFEGVAQDSLPSASVFLITSVTYTSTQPTLVIANFDIVDILPLIDISLNAESVINL
jgi:hypothetical protein